MGASGMFHMRITPLWALRRGDAASDVPAADSPREDAGLAGHGLPAGAAPMSEGEAPVSEVPTPAGDTQPLTVDGPTRASESPANAGAPSELPPVDPEPRPTPPAPDRITRPLQARISLLESLDLGSVAAEGGGVHQPDGGRPSPQASAKVEAHAKKIALRLRARAHILEGLSRAAPDPFELSRQISDDHPLAAQVLKMVNSPYYGLMRPAESVFQAVQLLGLLEIRNIVWRTSIDETLADSHRSAGELLADLWRHSFTMSRVAHAMARSVGLPRAGEMARAALLHDVGKFISLAVWPGWTQTFYVPQRFSTRDRLGLERDYMGTDHARLGADVARSWGLPTELCTTIEQHHAPIYYAPGRVTGNRRAIAIVYLADLLCHIAEPYLAGREMLPAHLPVPGWMSVLGLRDSLEAICTQEVVQALLPPSVDRRSTYPLSA